MGRCLWWQRSLCVLLLPTILTVSPLYADLGEIGDEVEKDQEQGPDERDPPRPPPLPRDDPRTEEDETGMAFAMVLAGVFIWAGLNLSSYYAPYPYGSPGGWPRAVSQDLDGPFLSLDVKRARGTFRVAGALFEEGGDRGNAASAYASGTLLGLFWPEAEYRWWQDDSGTLNFLRLGAIIPIVQTDPLTLGVPVAGTVHWNEFEVWGVAVGGFLQSYPVRPFSIEIRGGTITSPEVRLWEVGGRLAVHLNRFEIGAGYYGLIHQDRIIHTIEAGVAVHF